MLVDSLVEVFSLNQLADIVHQLKFQITAVHASLTKYTLCYAGERVYLQNFFPNYNFHPNKFLSMDNFDYVLIGIPLK